MEKIDLTKTNTIKDSNMIQILESLEERINKIEMDITNDKKYALNAIDEIQNQMKSLILMNEDMTVKLHFSSQKEIEHNNLIRQLIGKISKLENIDFSKKELKLNETKKIKLETEKSSKIKDINENNIYIILKFNDKCNINILERILKRKKDPWQLHKSKDNDEEFKIFDIQWFKRNLSLLANQSSEIILNNIETLDITEDIIFSNNTKLTSHPESNLNFKNNSSIIIESNVILNNLNVMDCHYGTKCLFEIKEASKLEFNNGFIENNSGKECLFYVQENASLILNKTKFNNNIQFKEYHKSCIYTSNKTEVCINNCQFLNHTSENYPYSASLIYVNGNLNISSSKFENNNTQLDKWTCIKCIKGNVNLDDVKFKNCSFINLLNCFRVNIKNSIFLNICAIGVDGGSILIYECQNINIEKCTFKNNETDCDGGALCLYKCKGNNYIKNCLFKKNNLKNANNGGAICFDDSEFKLEDVVFYKNNTKGHGGAIFAQLSEISCGNCTFESNSAKNGGALYLYRSNLNQPLINRFDSNVAEKNNDVHKIN